ncbi:hypothetical protein M409DRAFT_59403 [Zasmidium cellare ATCC 36951]|uniref:MYND-type domain-containing protein n=1 Tax=Zasmidium cellare ATCC 36951 TaxID=1080233 RepID=A0A6A6C274_ZASCE|nr:uncharacterized protein M409DRAFT_59403 [Zasmidium cellare ATCC 36951]KAF2161141.1 hypothetical protein M409DRAFT_59403 [Zasmidium cellare ATCC 36951]
MASPRCPSCTDTGTKNCLGCKSVKYCSEECQQADLPFHKSFCKLFENLSPRPSSSHRLTVFFPEDSTGPVLKWEVGREFIHGQLRSSHEIQWNPITGAVRDDPVYMYYDGIQYNYRVHNHGIDKVKGRMTMVRWKGPVVFFCSRKDWDEDVHPVQDVDAVACSDLVAFLLDFRDESPEYKSREARPTFVKVDAVKVTCPGERALTGCAPCVPVKVPAMHPIRKDAAGDVADVSVGINMPLLTWKYPPNASWPDVLDRRFNPVAHMHKGIDPQIQNLSTPIHPSRNSFGFPPQTWDIGIGNALVMRQDHQPLTPDEVEAFGDFAASTCRSTSSTTRAKELDALVLAEARPEKWEVYFEDWRKVKVGFVDDPEVNGRVGGAVRMGLSMEDGEKLSDCLFRARA